MLTEKQVLEVREHLEKAQNPIFLYDNDADGLCSYLLLRKYADRGKGVAVRSHPGVDEKYAKKAQELEADYIFVLDRPILGRAFVEEIAKLQIPVVWIDHHKSEESYENVSVFNPTRNKEKSEEPVSYLAYQILGKKEFLWISLMGCIADNYLPEFTKDFAKNWPEFWSKGVKKPFDAYYKSEIGRLARALGFALKDSVSHVVQLQNFLMSCKGPGDIFLELESTKPFARKYKEVSKKYEELVTRAKEDAGEKMLFFSYGGDLSISADVSNHLSYLYPKLVVVVAYSNGPMTNISMRGKNVRDFLEKIIKNFKNSNGGGHLDAVGARVQTEDLERFKAELLEVLENAN